MKIGLRRKMLRRLWQPLDFERARTCIVRHDADDVDHIQQTAEATGLTAHTLRYYERVGLIPTIDRGGNGHRQYSQDDLCWIEFVKCLRSTGMPICDIQRYLAASGDEGPGIAERMAIMATHRDRLQAAIEELTGFLSRIEGKVKWYREQVKE